MSGEWQVVEGDGWIQVPGFGQMNPRRDDIAGGRQYFTWKLQDGTYAVVTGESITQGPETYMFEFEDTFWVRDRDDRCLEVVISPLEGGLYAVKYRDGDWPVRSGGGW